MVGHLLAMGVVLLPFALLVALVEWQHHIQSGASLLVIGFGPLPARQQAPSAGAGADTTDTTGLWSFAVAIAHGAGLMLVPIYLGLCRAADLDTSHEAAGTLIHANLGGRPGLRRPRWRNDHRRRVRGVARLPLPGSQVRVAELVQSRGDVGLQSRLGGCALACNQPGEPTLSRIALGRTRQGGSVSSPARSSDQRRFRRTTGCRVPWAFGSSLVM